MPIVLHPSITAITPYVPGKQIEDVERELGIAHAIKLASNENALGASPKALAAFHDAAKALHRYPDGSGSALRQALASHWNVKADTLLLGNGSDEIIALLVKAVILPGDEAIMAARTFSIYEKAVRAAFGVPVTLPLSGHRYDLPRIAEAIGPKTRCIFVCNPNNPTGTIVEEDEVAAFLKKVPDHVVVVFDEAYAEYVSSSAFPDTMHRSAQSSNIVALRTFSKIYGLAGLRIGYGVMPEFLADVLNRVRLPFNTSSVAQRAALAALGDAEHVRKSKRIAMEGKAVFYESFLRLALPVIPSETNFVYVDTMLDGRIVYERLLRRGVIVRHIEGPMLRVTAGLPEENQRFVEAFEAVIRDVRLEQRNGTP